MTLRFAILCITTTACLSLLGCKPVPKPETSAATTSGTVPSSMEGVKPQDPNLPSASDRPNAPTIGAVEAGQAQGGANTGSPAAPTAGDRAAASAPPPAPLR